MALSVIVVDDESNPRWVLRRFLEKAGCSVREAPTATETLEMLAKSPADVVFSDVRMPQHDGLWLVEQLHRDWPRVAVVMVSGFDDYQTILAARKVGVVDYLLKPFGRETVLQALTRAIDAIDAAKADEAAPTNGAAQVAPPLEPTNQPRRDGGSVELTDEDITF
jgi:DNA-binding NtrC family response regulator